MRVAQQWEGEGQFECEQTCEEWIQDIFEKIQEKRFLFQWFVTSVVGILSEQTLHDEFRI